MNTCTVEETARQKLKVGIVIEMNKQLHMITRIEGDHVYTLALDGVERKYTVKEVLEATK